jgi:hypothetical protein
VLLLAQVLLPLLLLLLTMVVYDQGPSLYNVYWTYCYDTCRASVSVEVSCSGVAAAAALSLARLVTTLAVAWHIPAKHQTK